MQTAKRRLWRLFLYWRFHLFQQHRHDRLVLEEIAGLPILVLPGVFNPKLFRTGEFLARTLDAALISPDSTVLDMGTGSGVGAVFAARWSRRVVAVDVNPAAVRCARINSLLNQVEDRVDVRHGDLFDAVGGEQFDVVLFNPPFLEGEVQSDLDRALWATDVVQRFSSRLADFLTTDGRALVLLSTDGDEAGQLRLFHDNGLSTKIVARRDLINEVLTVYCVGQ